MTRIFNSRQAAEYLGVHEETVRRLARKGEIPAFKVGGAWRFKESVLESWTQRPLSGPDKGSVLVLDDDEAILIMMEWMLKNAGYRVFPFPDGESALGFLSENRPDAIVTDLVMPGMTGPDFIQKARRFQPGLSILVITGFPDSDLLMEAMQHSPVMILAKPLDREAMLEAVRMAVRR